jgi:hypothetical protein
MRTTDLYVFIEKGSKSIIEKFIAMFFKNMSPTDNYYAYPRYSKNVIFETEDYTEMFHFITESNIMKNYTFFFNHNNKKESEITGGIIKIYPDNSLCMGIMVNIDYLDEYKKTFEKKFGQKNIFIQNYGSLPLDSNDIRTFLQEENNDK